MVFYEQMTAQYINFWQNYHVAVKSDVIQRLCSASFFKKMWTIFVLYFQWHTKFKHTKQNLCKTLCYNS